jgi:hypothetical protein
MNQKEKDLVEAILTPLGISKETVKSIQDADDKTIDAIKADEIVIEIVDNQKEVLSKDEDFLAPIKRDERGAILAKRLDVFVKENSDFITKADVAALPEKDTFDAAVKFVAKKVKEKIASGNGNPDEKDKEILRLNAEVSKRNDEFEAFKENHTTEIEKVKGEYEGKMSRRDVETYLRKTFDNLGASKKYVADPGLLYPGIYSEMEKKFDFKRNESGEVVLLKKGTDIQATHNSKPYAVSDAFDHINTERDVYAKSLPIPPTPPKPQGETPEKFGTGNSTFKQKLEERKAAEAAKK